MTVTRIPSSRLVSARTAAALIISPVRVKRKMRKTTATQTRDTPKM